MKHSKFYQSKLTRFFLMVAFLSTVKANSQNAHFTLHINASDGIPAITGGNKNQGFVLQFSNAAINSLFNNYTIYHFEKAYPTSKKQSLQNVYEIIANDIVLMSDAINNFGNIYSDAFEIPEIQFISVYTPN